MQERLGRDAADEQASASEPRILFDDGCAKSVLCGAYGRGVAAWAATDNYQIECHEISF
jgi:hypothetical protein